MTFGKKIFQAFLVRTIMGFHVYFKFAHGAIGLTPVKFVYYYLKTMLIKYYSQGYLSISSMSAMYLVFLDPHSGQYG